MNWLRSAVWVSVVALMAVGIFDPLDQMFHLKVPLFAAVWLFFGFDVLLSGKRISFPAGAWLLVLFWSLVLPTLSISYYLLLGGGIGTYDGLQYWKSFLFLTLLFPLLGEKLDIVKPLVYLLCGLSALTIVVYILYLVDPPLASAVIWVFGSKAHMYGVVERTYGPVTYASVYFSTSPLLVIPVAYFTWQVMINRSRKRLIMAFWLAFTAFAMFKSGTRNNILFSILTPLAVAIWYSKRRLLAGAVAVMLLGMSALVVGGSVLQGALSSHNESNKIKLEHIHDYAQMFQNKRVFLFGQGLGAYFYSHGFGRYTSVTEITYFDLVRSFGLLMALVVVGCLCWPLRAVMNERLRPRQYLFIAFAAYLGLCTANPFLISSTGMLIYSVVLQSYYQGSELALASPDSALFSSG